MTHFTVHRGTVEALNRAQVRSEHGERFIDAFRDECRRNEHEAHGGDESPNLDDCFICRRDFDEAGRAYMPGRSESYSRAELAEAERR